MKQLAVRTVDFKLSYRLIEYLRRIGYKFLHLDAKNGHVSKEIVWFGTPDETVFDNSGVPIRAEVNQLEGAVSRAIVALHGSDSIQELMFGIDPGPTPGIAWKVNGMIIDSKIILSFEKLWVFIDNFISDLNPKVTKLRIGDGEPVITDKLVNWALARKLQVETVDEKSTSPRKGSGPKHELSAKRILHTSGQQVNYRRTLFVPSGTIKHRVRQKDTGLKQICTKHWSGAGRSFWITSKDSLQCGNSDRLV